MRINQIIIDKDPKHNPWTKLKMYDDRDTFQFAIVGDRTGKARNGVFDDAIHKLNLIKPEFVMSVGDLIQGYTEEQERIEKNV